MNTEEDIMNEKIISADDYIRRGSVNDAIRYRVCQGQGNKEYICKRGSCAYCGIMEIMCDISSIPSADVQPVKHGKWIEQRHTPTNGYNYNVPYSTYVCSSCGLEIHNDEYSKYVRGTYTNCPVCTARMDGDTNG